MNESQQATTDTCANCGAAVPWSARFCPACGVQVEAGSTERADIPPHETGPVPVSVERSEPHFFGVAPPNLLLATAVLVAVFAVVLFAGGRWPYGLILIGASALLLAAYLEAVRRRPDSKLTRTSSDARERARSSWEQLRARQAAVAETRRIQGALLRLESDRKDAVYALGAAAYARNAGAEAAARSRLEELDEQERALRAELARTVSRAEERIRQARLPVEDTMMVPPSR
jgi:hypothetical protein